MLHILTCRSICSRWTAPSQGDLVTSSITPPVLGRDACSAWPFASSLSAWHNSRQPSFAHHARLGGRRA